MKSGRVLGLYNLAYHIYYLQREKKLMTKTSIKSQ